MMRGYFKPKVKKAILISALAVMFSVCSPTLSLADDPVKKKEEIEKLQKQIESVSRQIGDIELEISSLNGRLAGVRKEIEENSKKLLRLEAEINKRKRVLEKRVEVLYKEDDSFSVSLILNSEGFFDFLKRIRFLIYLSREDAENIRELRKAKREVQQVALMLEDNKKRLEQYLEAYSAKKIELESLKENLNALLRKAKAEYRMMLTPERLKKITSRGKIVRGGGYPVNALVPRKFVRVSPYSGAFLTSGRMPDEYVSSGEKWTCYASWYGNEFHGRRTASGEIFNQWDFTVAHRRLPFGTFVLIRRGDRAIVAKVTDRGPFVAGREFDLSRACAEALGFSGVARIEVEIIFPK
jgi:rare lipoprotein A